MRSFVPTPLFVMLALSLSCGSSFKPDGASCPASVCSDRGTCTYANTFPTCACAEGYDGVVCSRCADGFHRGDGDVCQPDQTCTPGVCGANGVCQIDLGQTVCACVVGFSGPKCDTCRAGYHAESDGGCALDQTCLATSCSDAGACSADGGRVSCTCPAGRTGSFCEVRIATCAMGDPCGPNGRCGDQGGVIRCGCAVGYAGPTCERCYPGYAETDAGCSLASQCTSATCAFSGTCASPTGPCTCDPGYAGDACASCATGFHRNSAYVCVADEQCMPSTCGAHGGCLLQSGAAVCDCQPGYAGARCNSCYPGYSVSDGGLPDGGTGCVLDDVCTPQTCRFHGACTADAGVTSCACDVGFSGRNCETNIDDCANSACNTGRCIDLINSNVCLCDGGVFGASCP